MSSSTWTGRTKLSSASCARSGPEACSSSFGPHAGSVKGWITRLTPHGFHVWYYRHVIRLEGAGAPGRGPFPTYMRSVISPRRLARLAGQLGLQTVFSFQYEGWTQLRLREKLRLDGRAWPVLTRLVSSVTGGRLTLAHSDMAMVFTKLRASV